MLYNSHIEIGLYGFIKIYKRFMVLVGQPNIFFIGNASA
jgi:hypothetical protein